ncbi:hypothetical protein LPJ76_006313, partial [Coemansia sp. RSA 638]
MSLVPEIETRPCVLQAPSTTPESGFIFKDDESVKTTDSMDGDESFLQRQYELAQLDQSQRVNWEMIKKLTVCGVAFLNDAYDMFAINIVAMILGFVYYNDAEGAEQNT